MCKLRHRGETVDNEGCSLESQKDTDGDGVTDDLGPSADSHRATVD